MNDRAGAGVVLAEDRHHFLRLGGLGESGEAAQVAEHDRDVAAVAVENAIVARRKDELRHLRRQEALEPVHALDMRELLRHALLERAIPRNEIGGLRAHLVGQLLDPQHRLDPGGERGLVDRLGQIFVGARLEPGDDVLAVGLRGDQDDRRERQIGIGLDLPAGFDAVDLRHHDVEQDQIRMMLPGGGDRLLAIGRFDELVALPPEAGAEDVAIGLIVVDDENARWLVHRNVRRRASGPILTFASRLRMPSLRMLESKEPLANINGNGASWVRACAGTSGR